MNRNEKKARKAIQKVSEGWESCAEGWAEGWNEAIASNISSWRSAATTYYTIPYHTIPKRLLNRARTFHLVAMPLAMRLFNCARFARALPLVASLLAYILTFLSLASLASPRHPSSQLNVRPVTGIHRVSIKKNDGVIFCIDKPDVFSFPGSSAFVCFGNAKSADPRQTTRYQAQQKQAMSQFAAVSAPAETVEDVPVDLTGVRAADVELVMAQSGASKGKAANALRNCDGDIVNAIMELTM